MALAVPLSRFAPRVGGGSVLNVRPLRAMFIKTRILVGLVIVIALAFLFTMTAEWGLASGLAHAETGHYYHGLFNSGVGWPYKDFIHHLRTLSDSGDTNTLSRELREADERSDSIFDVWLDDKSNAYNAGIHEKLK